MQKNNKKRFINSFKYAIEGIFAAWKNEQNFKIHVLMILVVIIFGIMLKINKEEWIICIILSAFVISLELVNTAIENTVDLVTMEKKPKAKIAKDVAAASVLVAAITSAVIGLIIFVPKLLEIIIK